MRPPHSEGLRALARPRGMRPQLKRDPLGGADPEWRGSLGRHAFTAIAVVSAAPRFLGLARLQLMP